MKTKDLDTFLQYKRIRIPGVNLNDYISKLQNGICTNTFFNKINKNHSISCSISNSKVESFDHHFYGSKRIKDFWGLVSKFFN
ncbi:hypothetical protein BB560_001980 [Smittium megazygosporum]|uniref:Uncharacterized protein n=1 Tax=Smittium megazygosporum TaxID=133381 RepID=A0A2T9ZG58_9FUNG|nr:hypothetical protein BB560_001980 [Smittium megazygosporum]